MAKTIEQKMADLAELIDAKRAEYTRVGTEITIMMEEYDNLAAKRPIADDWASLLEVYDSNGREHSMKHYRALEKKCFSAGLLGTCGAIVDTGQYCIQIGVKDTTIDKTINGLKGVLPYIKYSAIHGGKYIGIMEYTLSQHGVYYVIANETEYQLCKVTYGMKSLLKVYDTVEDLVNGIYEICPRNRPHEDDDDDYY